MPAYIAARKLTWGSGTKTAVERNLTGRNRIMKNELGPQGEKSFYLHAETARENIRKAMVILSSVQKRLDHMKKNTDGTVQRN